MPLNNEAYETRTQGGLNQAMKKFLELMSTAALLIVLMMAVALVGVRVLGLTPYSVLSGSMEPAYSVGDLLYVKKVPTDTLEIGMPVTFVANENLVIVTHRIMDIAIKETKSEPVMLSSGKAAMGKDGKPIMQEVKQADFAGKRNFVVTHIDKAFISRTKPDEDETQFHIVFK